MFQEIKKRIDSKIKVRYCRGKRTGTLEKVWNGNSRNVNK